MGTTYLEQGCMRRRIIVASCIEAHPVLQVEQLAEVAALSAEHAIDEQAALVNSDEGEVALFLHEAPVRPYAAP